MAHEVLSSPLVALAYQVRSRMKKTQQNIGASVRARLLRLSIERREDFQLYRVA
jgi:hypothetical protein